MGGFGAAHVDRWQGRSLQPDRRESGGGPR